MVQRKTWVFFMIYEKLRNSYKIPLIILIIFSLITLSGCEDILTGAVTSNQIEQFHVHCADGVALAVLDYCFTDDDTEFIVLIANVGYSSVDSMSATFHFSDKQITRDIRRMNLEPTDSRVFRIPIYGFDGIEMVHLNWFFSSPNRGIRNCREDVTIVSQKIRTCDSGV